MVTIKDVARHSDCSPATVSLILNNHPLAANISLKTRNRVLKSIEELNYVPNTFAKSLRLGRARTLGILCFDLTDPFTMTILHGIEQHLNEQDYYYQLADVQNDPQLLQRFFSRIASQKIPGIIAMTNSLTLAPEKITRLIAPELTVVSVGRIIPTLNSPSVTLNNAEGIRLALTHLYELGHRRLAFILGPRQLHDAVERRDSILRNCQALGLAVEPRLMQEVTSSPATAESGARAIGQILARRLSFSAVMTFDDLTAYGAIQELHRCGLRVPADVSVIGHDDIWPSRLLTPPLTTVRVPMVEMGLESARMLLENLGEAGRARPELAPRDVVFKPELVVRETTGAPAAAKTNGIRRRAGRK